MKTAILLGLYHSAVDLDDIKKRQADGAWLWTMNDYYQFYPWLRPDAIFQVHKPEWLPLNTDGRWSGDYREIYNEAGCPIYTCWPDHLKNGVCFTNVLPDHFPMWLYQCTVVYMLAMALHHKFDRVEFEGMHFVDEGERVGQLPYIVEAIRVARNKGLEVAIVGLVFIATGIIIMELMHKKL